MNYVKVYLEGIHNGSEVVGTKIKAIGRIVNNLDTMAELVKKKEKRHDGRRSKGREQ